jgi:iron complex outermembrane recepter protein
VPSRPRKNLVVSGLAAASLTFGWSRAAAADAADAPATTVTVRGTPSPRSASETVVTKEVLHAAPHQGGSELLLTVPGVSVSQHGGAGEAHQIFFRGFDAVHGQDVEIWAGGAPVNDVSNIHGQGYADLHFLIPEVVEEVRSTPGNYDPTQGDFAVAGSLRFRLGFDEPGVTAKATLGSFGARRYFMAYHPKQADSATFGAVELYKTDGFGPSRSLRRGSAMAQVSYDFARLTGRALVSSYAARFDSAGVLRLRDVESGELNRFATYDPKQGGYSSRTQLVLELTNEASPESNRTPTRWSLSPYAVLRTLQLRNDYTGFLTSPEGDRTQQHNDATTLGTTASYRRGVKLFSIHDALEAGISVRADSIEQSQHRLSRQNDRVTDDELSPGVDARIRATNVAGYVDARLHPIRRVTLRGGLRADGLSYFTEDRGGKSQGQIRSAVGAQLSKRGTLDVVVMPGLNAILSYGEGFRSPQARSLGNGETTPFTRVSSYEVGARYKDGRRFQAALAGYRTSLSDDLAFDPRTNRNELVPGTTRTGVTASLAAMPARWLVSSTSVTYTRAVFAGSDAERTQGELLPFVPQLVVRSDLALEPDLGTLGGKTLASHFGLGLTYFGRRPLPYAQLGHDACLFDAGATLRWGPLETGLEAFNVFDRDWYDGEFVYASAFSGAASLVPQRHVTIGAPRSLFWSLAFHW